MKRRSFLKNSLLTSVIGILSISQLKAKNENTLIAKTKDKVDYVSYENFGQFEVFINNINTNTYRHDSMKRLVISDNNFYPFEFFHGEFGFLLMPMSNGAVHSQLYQLQNSEYVLRGENFGNSIKSAVSWMDAGVGIEIQSLLNNK